MSTRGLLAIALVWFVGTTSAFAQALVVTTSPNPPKAGQPFRVTISGTFTRPPMGPPFVRVSSNTVNLDFGSTCDMLCTPPIVGSVENLVPPLSAGAYTLVIGGLGLDTPIPFTVAPTADPNYSGLWWNPSESGMGVSIEHQANTIMALFFSYSFAGNNAGAPTWYVMPNGTKAADGSYAGRLYSTSYDGPAPHSGPTLGLPAQGWDPTRVHVSEAGFATLKFNDLNNGVVTLDFGTSILNDVITREIFAVPAP